MQGLWAKAYMRRVAVQSPAQQDGFLSLCSPFVLCPNCLHFFFLVCYCFFSKCYNFYATPQSFSYTEHLYTQNIMYIWLCTQKFVLSACCLDLLLFNITCSLSLLRSNSYTAFLTILFFFKCVNKTLSKLNFRKSGLQSWKSFWTQNFCKSTYQNS